MCHTVLKWSDTKYALLRQVIARRQSFFTDIRAVMRYMVFDSWERLMKFMIRDLHSTHRSIPVDLHNENCWKYSYLKAFVVLQAECMKAPTIAPFYH